MDSTACLRALETRAYLLFVTLVQIIASHHHSCARRVPHTPASPGRSRDLRHDLMALLDQAVRIHKTPVLVGTDSGMAAHSSVMVLSPRRAAGAATPQRHILVEPTSAAPDLAERYPITTREYLVPVRTAR